MPEVYHVVSESQHRSLVEAAYRHRGYHADEAAAAASICAEAARHGIRTHNAIKALHLDHLFGSRAGGCVPGAAITEVPSRFTAAKIWNANRKLGQSVAQRAIVDEVHKMSAYEIGFENAFDIALKTEVAIGFHIDDSMFWGRLKELNTPDNVEWLDWNRTPNTGRRLDWSAKPTKVMPQLCFNSKAVKEAVTKRAALIGEEEIDDGTDVATIGYFDKEKGEDIVRQCPLGELFDPRVAFEIAMAIKMGKKFDAAPNN